MAENGFCWNCSTFSISSAVKLKQKINSEVSENRKIGKISIKITRQQEEGSVWIFTFDDDKMKVLLEAKIESYFLCAGVTVLWTIAWFNSVLTSESCTRTRPGQASKNIISSSYLDLLDYICSQIWNWKLKVWSWWEYELSR